MRGKRGRGANESYAQSRQNECHTATTEGRLPHDPTPTWGVQSAGKGLPHGHKNTPTGVPNDVIPTPNLEICSLGTAVDLTRAKCTVIALDLVEGQWKWRGP